MTIPLGNIIVLTINYFFQFLTFLIIIRIFMSWLAPRAGGRLAYFIHSTTEPILGFFRRLPLRIGMLDLSPIVALFALDFTRQILLTLIIRILA